MKVKQIILIILIAIIMGLNSAGLFIKFVNFNQPNTGEIHSLSSNQTEVDRWNRTWGSYYWDEAEDVAKDSQDDIYIAGSVMHGSDNQKFCVIKYNSSGDEQFSCTWGGTQWDSGNGVAIDSMGNIYMTGYTWSYGPGEADPCLVKFNNSGDFEWYRVWGGAGWDEGNDLVIDAMDNIYVTGSRNSGSSQQMFLRKYNSSGDLQWNKLVSWGWTGLALTMDSTSEYIYVTGSGGDLFLAKYNTSGDLEWYRTLHQRYYSGLGIAADSSDNIYIVESENYLVKCDDLGYEVWNVRLSDFTGEYAYAFNDLTLDSSENIYIVGTKYNHANDHDFYWCKFNESGGFESDVVWGESTSDYGRAIVLDSEDNVYLAGTISTIEESEDLCLVKNPLNNPLPPPPPPPPRGTIESEVFQLFLYMFLACNAVSVIGITVYYKNKDPRQLSRD